MKFKGKDYRVVNWVRLGQDWDKHTALVQDGNKSCSPMRSGEFLQQLTVKHYVTCR
jgi:hypothetical protein